MDQSAIEVQARAREYLRTRGTEAPAEAIRASVREACESLTTLLRAAPVERVTQRPRDGEWSAQEVVDHLVETYRPGVDELRCLLARQVPPGPPIPASLTSKAPLLRPWPWLLRQLDELHADVLAALDAAPDDLGTDTRAPVVMVFSARRGDGAGPIEWIEALDWKAYAMVSWRLHTIDHLKQVRAALAVPRR
ncbi:MAG: DinB family protein [Candidatus Rokubacteria bacterium]|nr:DinB family protein [Candidatus Rokubacteria bacterium]